ncbi:Wzz/FepE/Etk N-terminal domain-containing protein [Deinococcus terrestris]|nr:Wzz/FepE/Etk N-terminal domain-containing protein [Deinococcus terrestris]
MDQSQAQDLDLQRMIRVLRRVWKLVLLCALALAAATFLVSRAQTPVYRSSVTLGALPAGSSNADVNISLVGAPAVPPQVFDGALRSPQVSAFALQRLRGKLSAEEFETIAAALTTPDRFNETVTLEANVDQQQVGVYILSAVAAEPETARKVADAYAVGLLQWDRQRARQNILRALKTLEARGNALSRQIAEAQTRAGQSDTAVTRAADSEAVAQQISQLVVLSETVTGTLTSLTPATRPRDPVSPHPVRDAIIAFGAALFFGFLFASVADRLKRTAETAQIQESGTLRRQPGRMSNFHEDALVSTQESEGKRST